MEEDAREHRPGLIRVVLTGSECTGKTTLAGALAAHYRTVVVSEYGREYVARKGTFPGYEDVEAIARGQIAAENAAARRADRLLIQDTDLLSTVVYSRHYFSACPEWVERSARARRADLYLLHHPDVPWVADGAQRDRPHMRAEIHELFREALVACGARYVDITGDWPERTSRARAAIDALAADTVGP